MGITLEKKGGLVAAGNRDTAQAAETILAAGGNAVDAIIAATLMSSASEAACISLGGGGFLNVAGSGKKPSLLDFFVQTPKKKIPESEVDFFAVDINFDGGSQSFHIGAGSMAVPGIVGGLWEAHQLWGRMPFKELAQPAIAAAKQGTVLDRFQAQLLAMLKPVSQCYAAGKELFQIDGQTKLAGDVVQMGALADAIEVLAIEGPDEFYRGEIANRLVQYCKEQGGFIRMEDMSDYAVFQRSPLSQEFSGRMVHMNPPPSAGGQLVSFGLQLLAAEHIKGLSSDSVEELASLIHSMVLTGEFRSQAGPDTAANFIAEPFNSKWLELAEKLGCTTHISVLDAQGMGASLTLSCGVGSGYYIPNTGIMMNNMLGEADLLMDGFHSWTPDQRLPSMMNPTIVTNEGSVELILGSGGSNRIRSAMLQVLYRCLIKNQDLASSILSPRMHLEGNDLEVESGFDPTLFSEIESLMPDLRYKLWDSKHMFFGGVHAIANNEKGAIAFGDPRRNGFPALEY